MKNKAFTLIELLVVVAIIGILAAVGVTTFNGFQEKAKISAAKSNYTQVMKYVTTELMKCELGEEKIFNQTQKCEVNNPTDTAYRAAKILDKELLNPIQPNYGVNVADNGQLPVIKMLGLLY